MSKTIYGLGMFIGAGLALVGCFGVFGLMAGRLDIALGGVLLALFGYKVTETFSWMYRTDTYPEHAITAEWNDDTADYTYTHEYYGRGYETGSRKWAEKLAKHYKITIDKVKA